MLTAAIWAGVSGCGSVDEPTHIRALAKPAGTVMLVGSTTTETGAPGGTAGGDAGTSVGDAAVATDAGAGFCAQLQSCGINEFFSPDLCTCLPAQ
jgi:hypothetical protein